VKAQLRDLALEYSAGLAEYLLQGSEQALLQAYQAGRAALAQGIGVLELAAIHQESLVSALLERLAPAASHGIMQRAAQFFAESLAAFEMTHRGLKEATASLRESNRELELRVRSVLEEQRMIRLQLEEQQRLERLKDEFISLVSHELRTPLTSIHCALALVTSGHVGELPPQAGHLVEIAHRNTQRLVRLAGDLLDLQRIESGSLAFVMRRQELASLLETALEANQAYGNRFEVAFVAGEITRGVHVLTDADRLMQVLTNLLSNAAKFSPPQSEVTLAAERRGAEVRVSVRDHGPGIPQEFRERIFQRFAQADSSSTRQREGTGLGLSISKAIIERMNGRIGFETQEGVGTTFFIDLPAVDATGPAGEG
jgi:signal transduction histidine kinase